MGMIIFFDLILEVIKYILAGYALFERKIETRCALGAIVTIGGIILVGNAADSVGIISILLLPFLLAISRVSTFLPDEQCGP